MKNQKIFKAEFDIIEHTAMQFAATFYEACRNSGMKPRNPRHKTERLWALHNFEKFIPAALEQLIGMLSRDDISEPMKEKIYLAIQERTNDPAVNQTMNYKSKEVLPELDLKKLLAPEAAKPIIVTDYFEPKKKSRKSKLLERVSTYG